MAAVRTWTDQVVVPTYPLHPDDVNPRFFELEGTLIYPYTMQDHLSRTKVDTTYRALFLENEYLRAMCIPALGGRILSVFDKLRGREMFYRNPVIKPGLIALRGAWFSGGVEWNRGPKSHTVTSYSPVDVVSVEHPDGSASFVIGYTEMNFRTAWEVRFTLHPGRAALDERIVIFNPTDGPHSYYFWNNTAFPNTPETRFCFPMKAASDHDRFFPWPLDDADADDDGRDLRWLRNYPDATPVFAYDCAFDFFGAYDVGDDYGIVQYADHRLVPGKKAWTWGQSDAGRMSQIALADDPGSYIEVQSGPLRTQTDYGVLGPGGEIAWQEWWYPVAGLGTGFEYATKDVAIERAEVDGHVEFRIAATAAFPSAQVELVRDGSSLDASHVDLRPDEPARVSVKAEDGRRFHVKIVSAEGVALAEYSSPLEIPDVDIPSSLHVEQPEPGNDDADALHARGVECERMMDRVKARDWHERALAASPSHGGALVGLARLDLAAGLYEPAADRLTRATEDDPDNGAVWHLLGVARLRQDCVDDALASATEAAARRESEALGLGVVGRVKMRHGAFDEALAAFTTAHETAEADRVRLFEWMLLAAHFAGESDRAKRLAEKAIVQGTTRLVPHAVVALADGGGWAGFASDVHELVGEVEFACLELGLTLAELGRFAEAQAMLNATLIDAGPDAAVRPLPLYHAAYYARRAGADAAADAYLRRARTLRVDYVFPSQVDAVPIFEDAVARDPDDATAHLFLGNLLAGLGRLDEACTCWESAGRDPALSVAFRNLGMDAWKRKGALEAAAAWLRDAVDVRPTDQVAHRDLACVLVAAGHRPEAIDVLTKLKTASPWRGDVTTVLARTYLDEQRFDDAIHLLEQSTYSNWEGDIDNWLVFVSAHIERGRLRLDAGDPRDAAAALEDFDAALTYPENLHVGRPSKPREARAQYWRGSALSALGRDNDAREAWQAGAEGAPLDDEQREFIIKCRAQLGDGGAPSGAPTGDP
ncbi:MAG: DUF5107 domain-containing protein [Vicinamibacterales bacterium]|jgi:tetratricopeptide (TPR) repeat protein|nr:hypothetical protein [Acidobacteriota bacterium]MDP6372272.1 DUF5107 domain-containing protein [Vicinamibacterales bacterium]MDP6610085.1 DUF5107 domain-containing protein [Vicinamibacterales bacterium]